MKSRVLPPLLPMPALAAALAAAALVAPVQPTLAEDVGAGRDVTQQVQTQTAVALPSLSPIVERVMAAVVNVSVVVDRKSPGAGGADDDDDAPGLSPGGPDGGTPFDELLRRFFEQRGGPAPRPEPSPRDGGEMMALGSGFVIDPTGYVVTNNHVVGEAARISVVFQDNSRHPAKLVGKDDKTDLALLKIDTDRPLPFVGWGDSQAAKVGDWVVAVGNPFGLGGSVTAGIISALGRDINAGPYDDFLQIDAPINRGNSGGPTFDLAGRVIGINTAIFSPSGGSVGIGFAIPSRIAQRVVGELRDKGEVTRGWLGVEIQSMTPAIARSLKLDPAQPKGALVASVAEDSPAAAAGVKEGDVITRYDGKPIDSVHDLPRLVAETPVDHRVDLTVERGGKEKSLSAVVTRMKEAKQVAARDNGRSAQDRPQASAVLGLQLAPLTDRVRKRLGIGDHVKGVLVRGVAENSPAAGFDVQAGDVIVSVDQEPVSSPDDVATKLRAAMAHGQALVLVNRGGSNRFVGFSDEDRRG